VDGQQERQANFHRGAQEVCLPGDPDLVCDLWTEISRHLQAQLRAEGVVAPSTAAR
jgi:cyclohexanone monooxygenase